MKKLNRNIDVLRFLIRELKKVEGLSLLDLTRVPDHLVKSHVAFNLDVRGVEGDNRQICVPSVLMAYTYLDKKCVPISSIGILVDEDDLEGILFKAVESFTRSEVYDKAADVYVALLGVDHKTVDELKGIEDYSYPDTTSIKILMDLSYLIKKSDKFDLDDLTSFDVDLFDNIELKDTDGNLVEWGGNFSPIFTLKIVSNKIGKEHQTRRPNSVYLSGLDLVNSLHPKFTGKHAKLDYDTVSTKKIIERCVLWDGGNFVLSLSTTMLTEGGIKDDFQS